MPDPFGSFEWICHHTTLPQCNLLFNQVWKSESNLQVLFPSNSTFYQKYGVSPTSRPDDTNAAFARSEAGSGLGNDCVIPRVTTLGSLGDIATVVLSFVSLLLVLALLFLTRRRRAAVGRSEFQIFLIGFGFMSAFQALTMSSMLEQGTTALVVLSAIHCAAIAALAWMLLYSGIIATQALEDGSLPSLISLGLVSAAFFGGTIYVALAVGFNYQEAFDFVGSDHPEQLMSIALFVLTLIWPLAAIFIYFIIMMYVTLGKLKEAKPLIVLIAALVIFAAGQIVYFLANEPLCRASKSKVNTTFLMSLAMDLAVLLIYYMWTLITEEDWDDHMWYA